MPPFEKLDRPAVARAIRAFVPMLRRRGWFLMAPDRGPSAERAVREAIRELLDGIRDDDPVREPGDPVWARVEASGLVLVGVGDRAFVVARVRAWGGLAARLLTR